MIHNSKIKVAVALSGGVDSAVAAKMLVDEGYEVIGLFLKLWKHDGVDDGLLESRKVAEFLKVPFYEIDAKAEFKRVVVEYFVSEYKNLRTPNPCTICNPQIKFKLLIGEAEKLGCARLATGHYARVENAGNPKSQNLISNEISNNLFATRYSLLAGYDNSKDQSYMLYRLNQGQLSKVIFPLGELTKKEVRELAKKWDLPVAEKKESQEICFLGNSDYRELLISRLGWEHFRSGDIVDTGSNVVGKHEGLINYTIGQRKGIDQIISKSKYLMSNEISKSNDKKFSSKSQNKPPLYVVGFNSDKNQLIVGQNSQIYKKEMIVSNLSWVVDPTYYSLHATNLSVKIRSQAKKVRCRIESQKPKTNSSVIARNEAIYPKTKIVASLPQQQSLAMTDCIKVEFIEPQRAITPGQSAVFYNGDKVVGGGVISSSSK